MPQPNLIYVFADQLRWSSLGCHGDPLAQTPNLDAFAADSYDFYNAVSGHPVCAPYRASLLTGKYTTSTGMVINEIRINPAHKSFAHVLSDGGYETCYIGKWHLYAAQLSNHYDPKNSFIPKGPDRLGFDDYFAAYNFHHEYYAPHAYYHLDTPEKLPAEGYEPDFHTDMAIQQLQRLSSGDKPFAMFLSLGTPHDPWTPENVPREYLERFKDTQFTLPPNYEPENDPHADVWARLNKKDRAQLTEWMRVYYAMTANLDDNFKRLSDAVERLGLRDNTIFVFTSDHGEMFGAHGRRAKNIFYDEAVRVPFFLQYKALGPPRRCGVCLNTVDIMPTLLTMMHLPCPAEVEGCDLSGNLDGSPADGALMMCTGPTAVYGSGQEWRAWRTARYTYATYRSDGAEYLFDHENDPYQQRNLAAAQPQLKEQLKSAMLAKMAEIGDDFEDNRFYKKHWVKRRFIQAKLPRRSEL